MYQITPIDPRAPDGRLLDEAVRLLAGGNMVIVPTETVYGLAVDPQAPGALERLFAAKTRPDAKPVAWFVSDLHMARATGVLWPEAAAVLAAAYWPGPLTLVLDRPDDQPPLGLRCPDYAPPSQLVARFGRPLAVTSANRSGEPPALTAAAAVADLALPPAMILDAGPSPGGVPSTVVRVSAAAVSILRAGALADSLLLRTLEKAKLAGLWKN